MKAKKSFGQHFLKSEATSARIANALSLKTYNHILEVGPGKGMLTKYLLEREEHLSVVEADRDMVEYLNTHYPKLKNDIYAEDFLRLDLRQLFNGKPFALIGNYPYNISSQIIFKMLDYKDLIPEMVGMFQREVGRRIAATPGNKEYGVISVLAQSLYDVEYLFTVDKSEFSPPPKVQSGVIRMVRKESIPEYNQKLFKSIVKQTFSQRRKMLRNTMKSFIKGDPLLEDPFFNQRPEAISLDDYIDLTNKVEAIIKK